MADGLVLVVMYVEYEVYMPRAHLGKGALRPHHCQYYYYYYYVNINKFVW